MSSLPCSQRAYLTRQFTSNNVGVSIKRSFPAGSGVHSVAKLSTDAIGSGTLSLYNIVSGTEVRLYDSSGNELSGGTETLSGNTISFSYNVYYPTTSGFYTLVYPGYRLIRLPITFSASIQNITIYQQIDSAYSST